MCLSGVTYRSHRSRCKPRMRPSKLPDFSSLPIILIRIWCCVACRPSVICSRRQTDLNAPAFALPSSANQIATTKPPRWRRNRCVRRVAGFWPDTRVQPVRTCSPLRIVRQRALCWRNDNDVDAQEPVGISPVLARGVSRTPRPVACGVDSLQASGRVAKMEREAAPQSREATAHPRLGWSRRRVRARCASSRTAAAGGRVPEGHATFRQSRSGVRRPKRSGLATAAGSVSAGTPPASNRSGSGTAPGGDGGSAEVAGGDWCASFVVIWFPRPAPLAALRGGSSPFNSMAE